MTFLNPPALALLAALPILALLAWLARGARRREVGTLFLWRRVAQNISADARKLRLEPLLLLLAGALAFGAFAAAQPAVSTARGGPMRVAVFVEALMPGGDDPDLGEVRQRAQQQVPGAILEFPDVRATHASSLYQQLAAFRLASREADARLMFLAAPDDEARALGRVLPRVTVPRDGVIFGVGTQGTQLLLRSSGAASPTIKGADLVGAKISGGETLRRFEIKQPQVEINATGTPTITLAVREPLSLLVARAWIDRVHEPLVKALPRVKVVEQHTPGAIGIGGGASFGEGLAGNLVTNEGAPMDLRGATITFAGDHPLFADLPLEGLDWLADGRGISPESGATSLVSVRRDGREIAHIVTTSADGKRLTFAGDPFARAPIATASLLLDNALGVITGERPSERATYAVTGDIPTERAALAAPFDPVGDFPAGPRRARPQELGLWPACLAAAMCWLAAMVVTKRRDTRKRVPMNV
ncbi:MAG: BatA domain-containing protein [Planctomycetes bacterium]|nr:BatA domain-containing protein [Planctomycetota bacterium]